MELNQLILKKLTFKKINNSQLIIVSSKKSTKCLIKLICELYYNYLIKKITSKSYLNSKVFFCTYVIKNL